MSMQWRGRETVKRNMMRYKRDAQNAVLALAQYWAPVLESYAKNAAPWTDRTGNARQSLWTHVDQSTGKTTIYLSHGVEYGVWLELRNQGKYAIIMPTLERHYQPIQDSYRRLFR